MTTQTIQGKRCPKGQIERAGYTRKGYTTKDGTRVKKTRVPASCITDRGTPGERSRGAKGGQFADDPEWIEREGKLGGPGYTSKPAKKRHTILNACVKKWGYRSCLGSIMVLLRSTELSAKVRKTLEADKKWLMDKYGGPGSFGPRKKETNSYNIMTKRKKNQPRKKQTNPGDYSADITGKGSSSTVPDNEEAVDATIYFEGVEVGEVTLLPAADGRPVLETWGSIDHWASSAFQAHLDSLSADDRSWAIDEVEAVVTESARRSTNPDKATRKLKNKLLR